LFRKIPRLGPPEWHCIAVLEVSLQTQVRSQAVSQPAVTRRPIGRRAIVQASSGFGRHECLSHLALATPVVDRAQCTLTRLPGAQCFLRHIGAAGFRVKWALGQEAVWLGWVVFGGHTALDPSPLPSPLGSCSDETRSQLDVTKLIPFKCICSC
jgi:hypothetical protein